ncbi:hypothetical protein GCM10009557_88060 [Virgisporangium ochraceum]|uniref:Uncharacterized protein n=1 Tax=Virgisporangium ochraceum TaxID=65505 RepID=A0A8J4EBU9_9ACTN|nr:hypothetical protein [Virgisporangium ochraceum]GIJ69775.1 hypothetical protein Voc01_046920 [Virgisporangium ochraceum]
MADPEDVEVREAFARFRVESLVDSPGPDLARVRGIARRRQVTRRTMLSVVALAVLAVPAVGYRFVGHQAETPVDPGPPQQVSGLPSERPSEEPSTAVSTSSATVQKPITRADILAATLAVPAWPAKRAFCSSGEVDLDKIGPVTTEQQLSVGKVISVDVDRDGDTEAVAVFSCGYEDSVDQVLAIGRDEQGGLRTMARVVASGDSDPFTDVVDLRPGVDAAVDVYIYEGINLAGPEYVEKQWRSYGWNGRQFTQVGGPRQWTPKAPPTDLGVAVTTAPFGAASNGVWTGGITVTVTNAGPNRAPGVYLELYVTTADSSGLAKQLKVTPECTTTDNRLSTGLVGVRLVCHQPALASGAGRETSFEVRMPVANGARVLNATASVSSEQPGVRIIEDTGGLANWVSVPLPAPPG